VTKTLTSISHLKARYASFNSAPVLDLRTETAWQ